LLHIVITHYLWLKIFLHEKKKTQNILEINKIIAIFTSSNSLVYLYNILIMTEILLKSNINTQQLNSLIWFLRSWNIEAEVKSSQVRRRDAEDPFAEVRGIWANRDYNLKEVRKQTYKRRTKTYDNAVV